MRLNLLSSIGSKILLLILILLVAGTSLPIAISYFSSNQAVLNATVQNVQEIVGINSKRLNSWIDDRKTDVQTLSKFKNFHVALQDTFIGKSARRTVSNQLSETQKKHNYYIHIGLADINGTVVASSNDELTDRNVKETDYFKSALANQLELTSLQLNETTRSTNFFVSVPINVNNEPTGVIFAQIDLGKYADDTISPLKIGETGYYYLADSTGLILVYPAYDSIMKLQLNQYEFGKEMMQKKNGVIYYDWEGQEKLASFTTIPSLGWILVGSGYVSELTSEVKKTTLLNLGLSLLVLIIAGVIAFIVGKRISQPIINAVEMIKKIAEGDYSVRLKVNSGDEIQQLAEAVNDLSSDLQLAVSSINTVMGNVAEGNLTSMVDADLKGELSMLKDRVNQSVEMLGQTISQAKTANSQVNTGARELSVSAQSLAEGTSKQAASLEEINSTLNEVDAQSKANNDNADQARQLSEETASIVERGDSQMQSMLGAMSEIENTAGDISKIIKVIDEIAFQTNLLALNAAVEAARAGKYGKGFAVVAEEVRNLAARSAEAAKSTTNLIENSVKEIENGVDNADKTAKILEEIKTSMTRLNDFVGEISVASKEQMIGIEEINKGLDQVNTVVQQNSSISEETASASDELSAQADQMTRQMSRFKTDHQDRIEEPVPVKAEKVIERPALESPPNRLAIPQNRKQILLDDNDFGKY